MGQPVTDGSHVGGNFPVAAFELVLFLAVVAAYVKRSNLIVGKSIAGKKETAKLQKSSGADELKKYKDLLDSGVITQEEFDAKKKQLLDL